MLLMSAFTWGNLCCLRKRRKVDFIDLISWFMTAKAEKDKKKKAVFTRSLTWRLLGSPLFDVLINDHRKEVNSARTCDVKRLKTVCRSFREASWRGDWLFTLSQTKVRGFWVAMRKQKEVFGHITCDLSVEFIARVLNGSQKYKLKKIRWVHRRKYECHLNTAKGEPLSCKWSEGSYS